jgi:hypothetical protein
MKTSTKNPTKGKRRNGPSNDRYEREDWTLFRSLPTICQLSGVPLKWLRRLVAKELTDNALDLRVTCRIGELANGGFFVEDDGPGMKPEDVALLFSFRRPLVSSKLLRLPTRGALGNGLRVLAGAVYASGGSLRVYTRGVALDLVPQESGETVATVSPSQRVVGTRIEVHLGSSIPEDDDCLAWARTAIRAAGQAPIYPGKTSPYWYDIDALFELLKAAGQRTVRNVLQDFDGTEEWSTGIGQLRDRAANSLTYKETEKILEQARASCAPIQPKQFRLLKKGPRGSHAKVLGTLDLAPGRGSLHVMLPYTIEAWCHRPASGQDRVTVLVNRTPVTGDVQIERAESKADVTIFGCNLGYRFSVGRKPVDLTINVQIPYMPITSSGKEPDLELFREDLQEAVEAAARRCQRANRGDQARPTGPLPCLPKGRPSDEDRQKYAADLRQFAESLKKINSTLDFKVSSRGWCYILENEHGLSKGDFDKAQDLINECRKSGLLPIDFTVEDEARGADNLEKYDDTDPARYAAVLAGALHRWTDYSPGSFWDNQPVYIQMVVEKIDLKYLFLPVCRLYRVPLINSRGWSDLNLRAALMRRFQEHERLGRRPVLLCCNDHDPVGLQIPNLLPKHLEELREAVGWSPHNLTIERFGLNADFIEMHDLTWIDGLKTGSGKDLGDSKHKQHNHAFVQDYIAEHGKRKVEANALVVRPEAGRHLCRESIERHLDMSAIATYERSLAEQRAQVKSAMPDAVERVLHELRSQALTPGV